jgi:hypothetical protein
VLKPDATGWDKYCRRINSVARVGDHWLAFYDGSASEAENYEERCALAVSTNLRDWRSVSPDGPFVTSPFATGSARYFDAKFANGQWHLFYEFARKDGAHDMRVVTLDPQTLAGLGIQTA